MKRDMDSWPKELFVPAPELLHVAERVWDQRRKLQDREVDEWARRLIDDVLPLDHPKENRDDD